MKAKILLYDEDEVSRETIHMALLEQRCDAEAVTDLHGLEKALSWWRPDAVIVDVSPASCSIVDLCQCIRAHQRNIPILLKGAFVRDSMQRWAHDAGADDGFSTLGGMRRIAQCVNDLILSRYRNEAENNRDG